MKRLLIAAIMILTVSITSFAEAGKVSPVTKFESAFLGSGAVKWTTGAGFKKASFTVNDQKVEVYYNLNGEMIGTSKTIEFSTLSEKVQAAFKQQYPGYTVKETIFFDGVDKTAFFISAANDKESIIIEVKDNDEISIFKTDKK